MSKGISGIAAKGLVSLNGNVLCSIDVETTGLVAGHNDIIEFACTPLDANFQPHPDAFPFQTLIKPKNRYHDSVDAKAMAVNQIKVEELVFAADANRAADTFVKWVDERLQLAPNKKIAILGWNYAFDKGFILDWLGPKTYDFYFHYHYRDGMQVALSLNDRAELRGKEWPFPKVGLQDVANKLGVREQASHRALPDSIRAAETYGKLVQLDV